MSNLVLVIDSNKKPCDPVKPGYARMLLKLGKAAVFRRYPFTLILKREVEKPSMDYELKLDPGSKTTGIALVREDGLVVFGAELEHRGQAIKAQLDTRKGVRRSRRNRKVRYRAARFLNRTKTDGWLAPSLKHRVLTTMAWVNRLVKYAPVASFAQELVKFDTHKMQNPDVAGIEYQHGTLHEYEVKEYLLEKWGRKCAYCGKKDVPLEVEHIIAKVNGGSNRPSNLTLACECCNRKKGSKPIDQFLAKKPKLLAYINRFRKLPLKDAAAVNSTRWALFNALKEYGLKVNVGSGAQTKFNRKQQGIDKAHWKDAAAVGNVQKLTFATQQPLLISAKGRNTRRMCRIDAKGFPCSEPRKQYSHNWKTGDVVTTVKDSVRYVGRCVVQSETRLELRIGKIRINKKLSEFKKLFSADGYLYRFDTVCTVL